jgi:maltose-binding protein MalE
MYDGKMYGMPFATENLGFFYNTDLVPTAPTTWDEVITMGTALKGEGKVDFCMGISGTTYDLYPLFTAFGGYIFGKDANGNYNPEDLGLDNEGMIKAGEFIDANVKSGCFSDSTDWDTAHVLFETGKVPFLMAGPWALDRIRASGVKYAITDFPSGGLPFSGVQVLVVNSQSENILLAQAFLTEFVATDAVMEKLYIAGNRPSPFKSVLEKTADADFLAMGKAGINATSMPTIPAMGAVWGSWNDAVTLIFQQKQAPADALKEGAVKIRNLIANPLTGMVNVPGSYQAAAGCSGDWLPDCDATKMTKADDGTWTSGPFKLPAGDYEAKVAMDGTWGLNYGMEGKENGDNYKFSLTAESEVSFVFDPTTKLLTINIK